MKIVSSNLSMNASHVYQEKYQSKSTLVTQKIVASNRPSEGSVNEQTKVGSCDTNLSDADKHKLELIKRLFKLLTGQEMSVFDEKAFAKSLADSVAIDIQSVGEQEQFVIFFQTYSESERMDFSAQGQVVTEQGQIVNFDMSISMSRQFMAANYALLKEAKPTDPLVINFSGKTAELSTQKIDFDLNGDGQLEKIAFMSSGSGFLALDKNGDNKINDGGELFGPDNGDGFASLAAYDEDNNGWIDENDPVFSKLKIWTQEGANNTRLFSLADVGIGAISLSRIDTPFTYKDAQNQSLGQLSATGVALKEAGGVVSVQQINLFA